MNLKWEGTPTAVSVAGSTIEAEVQKAMLESYGIPTTFRSDTILNSAIRTVTIGSIAEVTLMVPASKADEAGELLKAWREGDLSTETTEDALEFQAAARAAAERAESVDDDPRP